MTELAPEKFVKDCECEGCSFYLRLEAERFSTKYRTTSTESARIPTQNQREPNRTPQPNKPTLDEKRARYERDKLFYDSGRFAAGARDDEATEAFKKLAAMKRSK